MSRDVIKKEEFQDLFSVAAERGIPTVAAPQYSSTRVRFRELLERLQEAEDRERASVEKAASEAREQALGEAKAEYEDTMNTLRKAASELQKAVARNVELAGADLADLSTAIASKIVRREIRQDDEYVIRLVRRCLSKILRPTVVRIRVHPDDRERVAEAAGSLTGETDARHQISFEADQRVERGGCVVETPDFVVDARRDTQLEAARESMEAGS